MKATALLVVALSGCAALDAERYRPAYRQPVSMAPPSVSVAGWTWRLSMTNYDTKEVRSFDYGPPGAFNVPVPGVNCQVVISQPMGTVQTATISCATLDVAFFAITMCTPSAPGRLTAADLSVSPVVNGKLSAKTGLSLQCNNGFPAP